MAHTTFHGKKGRFSSASSAHTVTKNGERYKVVRQHRKMKPKSPGKSKKMAKETIDLMVIARSKIGLVGLMDGVPYVSLRDLLGG